MSIKRRDVRGKDGLRPLTCVFDGLDRADGSARFGFGETKALASVSGPIEVRLMAEQASRATFEVIIRPLSGIPGTESKSMSSTIRSLLSPAILLSHNPRTLIQLVVQSLTPTHVVHGPSQRFSSSLTAAFINASSLALLNAASIPMCGVVCAVAVGRLRSELQMLVVDPSEDELGGIDGEGCFAFMFASGSDGTVEGKPVWTDWRATRFDEEELGRARLLAKVASEMVWNQMKDGIAAPHGKNLGAGGAIRAMQGRADDDAAMRTLEVDDDDRMEI